MGGRRHGCSCLWAAPRRAGGVAEARPCSLCTSQRGPRWTQDSRRLLLSTRGSGEWRKHHGLRWANASGAQRRVSIPRARGPALALRIPAETCQDAREALLGSRVRAHGPTGLVCLGHGPGLCWLLKVFEVPRLASPCAACRAHLPACWHVLGSMMTPANTFLGS